MGSCLDMWNGWVVILMIVLLLLVVTIFIARRAAKKDSEEYMRCINREATEEAQKTINEAKTILEGYSREGETLNMVDGRIEKNKHTLGELTSLRPTEEQYRNYVRKVGEKVGELYEGYQFSMYEPASDDLVSGYLLQFQILGHEEVYNDLFKYAMDKGLDMDEIDEYFYEELTSGGVIPVGDGIMLERDGTGISPIKSGDDVRIIISFVTEEYKRRQEEAEKEKDGE